MRTTSIGQLAKAAGVGVETVRFSERKGLLDPPARTESGYRQYGDGAVERLRFVRRAQGAGFTLAGVADLLALRDGPAARRADVRGRAAGKIAIDAKVRDLLAVRNSLARLLTCCDGDGPASGCPIVTALNAGVPAGEFRGESRPR